MYITSPLFTKDNIKQNIAAGTNTHMVKMQDCCKWAKVQINQIKRE